MKGLRSDYLPSFFNFYFFFLLTAKNLAKGLGSGQEFDRLLKKEFSIQILILRRDIERIFSPMLYTLIFLFFTGSLICCFFISLKLFSKCNFIYEVHSFETYIRLSVCMLIWYILFFAKILLN